MKRVRFKGLDVDNSYGPDAASVHVEAVQPPRCKFSVYFSSLSSSKFSGAVCCCSLFSTSFIIQVNWKIYKQMMLPKLLNTHSLRS